MKSTEAFEYVALRARQYGKALGDKEERIEYYFAALLVYANLDPAKIGLRSSEINQIKRILADKCMGSLKETEIKLFKTFDQIKTAKNFDQLKNAEKYINIAKKYASDSYQDQVAAFHLAAAILHEPTPVLKELLKKEETITIPKEVMDDVVKKMEKPLYGDVAGMVKKIAQQKEEEELKKMINDEKIVNLMQNIDGMTNTILQNVKGQDHAVRAVAEGFFNAELLADADQKRVRPRATFLFAGPPGVGKTFLAEQMASYLGLPYRRFDMSSYSDHHAGEQLIGQTEVYRDAKEGILTKFVKDNPKCVILFDEVEKAHTNVIYLFYQMLDAGVLEDQKTNRIISFKDTYIIFTTNAGHNLYEGKEDANLSAMSKKKIMSGIENDINPLTKEPFFPTAMCSRLSAGTVLMFNHLKSHNLLEIASSALKKNAELFRDQYGIEVEFDDRIPSLLMYREGGMTDARSLRGQCDTFFKSRILDCLELFDFKKVESMTERFHKIKFYAEDFEAIEKLNDVFKRPAQNEVMFFGNDHLGKSLEKNMPEYSWNVTSDEEEAFRIFAAKDIRVILLDIMTKVDVKEQQKRMGTMYSFDNVSIYSQAFDKARSLLKTQRSVFRRCRSI